MYSSNLLDDSRNVYKADPFLQAFAQFVERLPDQAFAYKNKCREIVDSEVLQVIKVLFEGQTRKPEAMSFLRSLYNKLMA